MGPVAFEPQSALILCHRNVLGGNFSLVGVPSVGASGAIFGTLAVRSAIYSLTATESMWAGDLGRPRGSLEVPLQTCSQGNGRRANILSTGH